MNPFLMYAIIGCIPVLLIRKPVWLKVSLLVIQLICLIIGIIQTV
jgi:uncharacterized membrane protein